MELSGLRIDITIGDLEVWRCPIWWIESYRGQPLGRAGITLPDPDGSLQGSINVGDSITFEFGYRDEVPVTWSGTVAQKYPGETRDQIEVRAVDPALPLTTTRVCQSWLDETPEAIVKWALKQTGLPIGTITPTGITIPRFVASDIPAWQLVKQVTATCGDGFGLDVSQWDLWLGSGGVNWGTFDEPGDVPVIATGTSLLEHEPSGGDNAMSMVETWLQADLTHSRLIHIQDDRRNIDTTVRARRVRHEGKPDSTRTFIWY